jgi:uncharacterized protein YaaN involved in tellurite resistance
MSLGLKLDATPEGNEANKAEETTVVLKPTEVSEIEKGLSKLTPEEESEVRALVSQIDIHDITAIGRFGESAQKEANKYSDKVLASVRNKDLGAVGEILKDLVKDLKGFDLTEKKKGFFGIFQGGKNFIADLKIKYDTAADSIQHIADELQAHQLKLYADSEMLDKLFDSTGEYFRQLMGYCMAGKLKLEEVKNGELLELREKAKASGEQLDAQAVNDLLQQIDRFEKRLMDIELTRTVCLQMLPQIRLVQNNDMILAEKIQSTVSNALPLWKNQMVIFLATEDAAKALEATKAVGDFTNTLLRENADRLEMTTIDIAKEAERGIIDIETLQYTHEKLLNTIDSIDNIQREGKAKRVEASAKLAELEESLKAKLLETKE